MKKDMKKLLSITLTLVLMLSLSVPAFAEVNVQGGTSQGQDSDGTYIYDSNNDSLVKEVEVESDKLKINGPVANDTSGSAVSASDSAKVTVTDVVFDCNHGDAINASDLNTTVTVKGNVEEYDEGNAINAKDGATVEIDKDVTESGNGDAINAAGKNTIVTVNGNVTESDNGNAIYATDGATVKVGGDVFSDGKSSTIKSFTGAKVIVEGLVTYDITNDKTGEIYLGQLGRNIMPASSKDNIHYLIGTADGQNNKINVIGTIVSTDTIDGVKNKGYYYTTTADSSVLSGKSFAIKSTNSNKKIKINETYDGVTIVNNPNGTITLTIGENFKGGIQALNVIFEDIAREISSDDDSYKPIFTGSKGNPVTNGKWTRNADGTWTYATVYKFSNTWGYIANPTDAASAAWYYFDRNGNMLTGWQKLYWNGVQKWYYFSQTKDSNEGKCLVDCITPDGYKVGPDGAWIED